MEYQLDLIDVMVTEPMLCTCGRIPNLVVNKSEVYSNLYSYHCECGIWQTGNGGVFVSYKTPEEALRNWNKPNKRRFNQWHDWKRPEKQGQISLFLED